jgi:hypothetical protein
VSKPRQPSVFGQYIRAARLGFHWSEPHRAFIRMRDAGPGRYMIEACAPGTIGARHEPGETHRVWWDDKEAGETLLNHCAPLVDLREDGGLGEGLRRTWFVDDNGLECP